MNEYYLKVKLEHVDRCTGCPSYRSYRSIDQPNACYSWCASTPYEDRGHYLKGMDRSDCCPLIPIVDCFRRDDEEE